MKQGEELGRMPGVEDEKEEIDGLLIRCNRLLAVYEKTTRDVDREMRRACVIVRPQPQYGGGLPFITLR